MRNRGKGWRGLAVVAAVLAGPVVAHAHDLVCEKTANGETVLDIFTYPTTVVYDFTVTNIHPTLPSIATSISDPMFPNLGFTVPLTLQVGESETDQQTIVIDSFEECTELGGTPDDGTVTLTNTLTVGFDGGPTTCTAKVICHEKEEDKGCLTRTPGYWGTHPEITFQFLPVTSCGVSLGSVTAGQSNSIIEDLCSVGKDHKQYDSPQEAQLVRQCAAAALNIEASESLGGSCTAGSAVFARCCSSCGDPAPGCIEDLDAFNNSADTLLEDGGEINLCHELGLACDADPGACQAANGNGFVIDRVVADAPTQSSTPAASASAASPLSGGCSGGAGDLLALLGPAGLLALRRRR